MFTNEKKKGTRDPKNCHMGLCPHLATSLLWPHLDPWVSRGLSVILHLYGKGIGM